VDLYGTGITIGAAHVTSVEQTRRLRRALIYRLGLEHDGVETS
jgi:hypothetical protein